MTRVLPDILCYEQLINNTVGKGKEDFTCTTNQLVELLSIYCSTLHSVFVVGTFLCGAPGEKAPMSEQTTSR